MTNNDDSIFDILHSLPVITHSVSLANRTPTNDYGQATKYMPDYGGVLETPDEILKNNSLTKGLPIRSKSNHTVLNSSLKDIRSKISHCKPRCLSVASHPKSKDDNVHTVIRAFGNQLYVDLLDKAFDDNVCPYIENYASIDFREQIQFINYQAKLPTLLQVGFSHRIRVLKLNEFCDPFVQDGRQVAEDIVILSDPSDLEIKDSSINQFNSSLICTASDNIEECQVKIYDINKSTKNFYTLSWPAPSKVELDSSTFASPVKLRTDDSVRRFVPRGPSKRGVQQIDNIPSHLVNMLLTNDYQTVLVDPRSDRIGQIYVDKMKNPSFYPIEYLRKTCFSTQNQYQFYSMSNVHLRVFDTRFIGIPLNQSNHMLDSDSYVSMDMKVIKPKGIDYETLCMSSPDKICFISFDQGQENSLANPELVHLPYHDDLNADDLYSMDVHVNEFDGEPSTLFNVMQLSKYGNIHLTRYGSHLEDNLDRADSRIDFLTEKVRRCSMSEPLKPSFRRVIIKSRKLSRRQKNENIISSTSLLNIVESGTISPEFTSKRAEERYNTMLSKLDWC